MNEWLKRQIARLPRNRPQEVFARFGEFKPCRDRDKALLFVMTRASLMRVRGHGPTITFEYNSVDDREPMRAIRQWGARHAGPELHFHIVNLRKPMRVREVKWRCFGLLALRPG